MRKKAGERTLLASVLLSAPGPIVLGAALMVGRSATQLADFIRRTAELGAIIVSWAVYRILNQGREPDPTHQARLERTASSAVGLAMCLSGAAMLLLALFSSGTDKGNVLPALIIALLGVLTNSCFGCGTPEPPGRDAILPAKAGCRGKDLSGWVRDSSPGSRLCCPSFRCGCVR